MFYFQNPKPEMSDEFMRNSSLKSSDAVSEIAGYKLEEFYNGGGDLSLIGEILDMDVETWNDWMATLLMGYEINA